MLSTNTWRSPFAMPLIALLLFLIWPQDGVPGQVMDFQSPPALGYLVDLSSHILVVRRAEPNHVTVEIPVSVFPDGRKPDRPIPPFEARLERLVVERILVSDREIDGTPTPGKTIEVISSHDLQRLSLHARFGADMNLFEPLPYVAESLGAAAEEGREFLVFLRYSGRKGIRAATAGIRSEDVPHWSYVWGGAKEGLDAAPLIQRIVRSQEVRQTGLDWRPSIEFLSSTSPKIFGHPDLPQRLVDDASTARWCMVRRKVPRPPIDTTIILHVSVPGLGGREPYIVEDETFVRNPEVETRRTVTVEDDGLGEEDVARCLVDRLQGREPPLLNINYRYRIRYRFQKGGQTGIR